MKKSIPNSAEVALGRRPSVRDVARLAGVSAATVSRALSRPALVRQDKLNAVLGAVAKLSYVAQGAGRALVSRRSFVIGAIVPSFEHAMFAKTTFALQSLLAQHGYMLALATSDFNIEAEPALARHLIERGVDGIVLFGRQHHSELLTLLDRNAISCASTWAFDPASGRASVGFDNRKAAILIVDHLLGLGHTEIGIISGYEKSEWQHERLHWMKAELERHEIRIEPDRFFCGPIGFETGRVGVTKLMGSHRPPTAIICGHDIIAVGAIAMCNEMGVAVPAALSLTGFEDLELASNITPPLTTVHFPAAELGAAVGEEILNNLAGKPSRGQIEFPIELRVRGTTATPATMLKRA